MLGSATQICLNVSQCVICINESNISVALVGKTRPWICLCYVGKGILKKIASYYSNIYLIETTRLTHEASQ